VVHPPNIPCAEIPVVDPLEEAFGVPVRLANDCLTGIPGEALFGAARGFNDAVYITISTGIGAGIIAGGTLLLGSHGNAGEVGHIPVDSTYNVRCGCGYTGHWEGFASGRHLPEFFAAWHTGSHRGSPEFPASTAKEIYSAARNGHPRARAFVDVVGKIHARGISAVIVAYDPEVIILDGAIVVENQDLIVPAIERYADRFLPLPRLRITALEGRAPLLGASVIANGYDTPFGSLLGNTGSGNPPARSDVRDIP
jgi:glucokinase